VYWRSTDHGGECSREHLTAPQVAHSRTQEEPMSSPIAMARFDRGWPLAGIWAAVVSIMVLGAASLVTGQPFWMPLNATSHGLYGPEAAQFTGFDLAHTVVGAVIHVASCFFWAAVAVLMLRGVQRGNMAL